MQKLAAVLGELRVGDFPSGTFIRSENGELTALLGEFDLWRKSPFPGMMMATRRLSRRDLGRDRGVGQGLRCGVPERVAGGCALEYAFGCRVVALS